MSSTIVTLILGLVAQLPEQIAAIQAAYQNIRAALSAKDQATLDALFKAVSDQTDADWAAFGRAVAAHMTPVAA